MIYAALTVLAELLNAYLSNRFGATEDRVVLSNIVDQEGKVAIQETDKIILTLINMEEEAVISSGGRLGTAGGGFMNRPVNMNLFILFSAYFSRGNYEESLKFLSATISFFQANRFFDHQNTPDLDDNIEKMTCEIVNTDLQSLSHLWGVLGGKHMPSIMYKVRMVSFQEGNIESFFNRVGR